MRPLPIVPAVLAAVALVACDDGGDGVPESDRLCARACDWLLACDAGPEDPGTPLPPPGTASEGEDPDPQAAARSACLADCLASWQVSRCARMALPGCVDCLEAHACEEKQDCVASCEDPPGCEPAPPDAR